MAVRRREPRDSNKQAALGEYRDDSSPSVEVDCKA